MARSALCASLLYGQGEIRTLDTVAGMPVFETGAFNHSATCPTALKAKTNEPPIEVVKCGLRIAGSRGGRTNGTVDLQLLEYSGLVRGPE